MIQIQDSPVKPDPINYAGMGIFGIGRISEIHQVPGRGRQEGHAPSRPHCRTLERIGWDWGNNTDNLKQRKSERLATASRIRPVARLRQRQPRSATGMFDAHSFSGLLSVGNGLLRFCRAGHLRQHFRKQFPFFLRREPSRLRVLFQKGGAFRRCFLSARIHRTPLQV